MQAILPPGRRAVSFISVLALGTPCDRNEHLRRFAGSGGSLPEGAYLTATPRVLRSRRDTTAVGHPIAG